tara:strand:- start:4115 stop:4825 length:711 start_codon:yes stop_codon:yes gene_type:complete
VLVTLLAFSTTAGAQDAEVDPEAASRDREARSLYEAGTEAFEAARYGDALQYYQRAYEVSGRAVLLYNIGVSADRMRRDEQALEAFEAFLEQVPEHPRRHEVEVRVVAIREAQAAGEEPEPTESEPTEVEPVVAVDAEADGGISTAKLVGAIALGAVGVAGVVASVIGMTAGGCVDEDATGACMRERTTNWGAVGAYGGLGLVAIAGAIVLLVVGGGDADEEAHVRFEGNGVRWQF